MQPLSQSFTNSGSADIDRHRLVKFSGDSGAAKSDVVITSAATDAAFGVSGDDGVKAGGNGHIVMAGIAKCVAGGNISRGAYLQPAADGEVTEHSGTNRRIGIALDDAVDGDTLRVLISQS